MMHNMYDLQCLNVGITPGCYNRRYQDLHATAGNTVHVLSPPVPVGTTLADRLRSVPRRVVEVVTYCIRLGATLAMATA
jgi:hypothetical protein